MITDYINAVGHLWKLVLSVAVLVGLFLFRGPIAAFINRLRTIRLGANELQTEEEESQEEDTGGDQKPEDESTSRIDEELAEDSEADDAFARMYKALQESDLERAEDAYQEYRATAEPDEVDQFDAVYLYLRYTVASDAQALTKLRGIASDSASKARVLELLGRCYLSSKDYSKARGILVEARDAADELHAARLTAQIADCWNKEGDPNEGLSEVIKMLVEVESADAKVHLYKSLASVYQAKGWEVMRAIALEKALQFAPRDTELRFNAAYSQREANLVAAAISNYDTLLTFQPNDRSALNNLGVACKGVGLPFRSVDFYQKAADEENSLAMANLAHLLMEAGFHEQASEELSRASELTDPHENVSRTKANLEARKRKELEKWDDLLETGVQHQQFLRDFAEASLEGDTEVGFYGKWRLPSGEVCSVESDEGRMHLEFNHEGKKRRLEAGVRNRSAEGMLLLWKKEWYHREGRFEDEVRALAAVSSDGRTLAILGLSDSWKVIKMSRITE